VEDGEECSACDGEVTVFSCLVCHARWKGPCNKCQRRPDNTLPVEGTYHLIKQDVLAARVGSWLETLRVGEQAPMRALQQLGGLRHCLGSNLTAIIVDLKGYFFQFPVGSAGPRGCGGHRPICLLHLG
jgi:hypothetical protein